MITPKEYFQETDRMLVRASVNSEEYPVDKEVLRTFYGYYGPHEQFKDWCRDNLDDINKLNDKVEEIEDELGDAKNALKDFKWESGSDVQALWRKHGWTPPSEHMPPPPPERVMDMPLRRVR